MKRSILFLFLFLSIFIFVESAFSNDITFHGFVSGSYSYNFNTPDFGQNQLRVFDFDDNTFKIDVAEVVLEKTIPDSGNVGFRVDFVAGSSIPRIIASAGLFRDPDTGEAEDFDLEQAYVSVNASGLHLDFGKFITHTGAEVIEGYDGFNDNYSRSLLFGFAIPFTHTGLRASYAFNDRASAMVMLANGWDNVKDNNRGKTFGAQFLFVPVHGCSVYLNYIGGPEQNDSSNMRNLFDAVAVWKPVERFTLTFNYDYAKDNDAVGPGIDATWKGFAVYGKVDVTDTFSLTVRGEQFKDEDGVRTGVIQKLREFTITPSVKIGKGFVARGDLRFDHSNKKVFQENDSFKQNQTTIALNLLYFF